MKLLNIISKDKQPKWLPSLIFGTVVGIIIAVLIVAWAGLGNVLNNFRSVQYAPFAIYIGLVIGTNILRAWRFRLLMNKGTMSQMYGVVSVHTLMINLLPFGSGEISFPLLLKRYAISDGFMQGIPSLMIARLQDVFVNLVLALIALVWVGSLGLLVLDARGDFLLYGGLALLPTAIIGLLLYRRLLRKLPIAQRVNALIAGAISSFREIPPTVWGGAFVITVAIRIVSLISVFYLLESIGLNLPVPFVFLFTSLYVFLPLLPINSVAGVGLSEAYSVTIFVLSGIGRGVATAASVQIHVLQLIVAVVLGVFGFLLLQYLKRRKHLQSPVVLVEGTSQISTRLGP